MPPLPRLYANLDHVATLREARGTPYPDPVEAALLAERSGHVQGITLHLREDRRHVNDDDVRRTRAAIRLPFNFEMSVAEDIVACCLDVAPDQATLVPERREEVTTEGGLDLERTADRVGEVVKRLQGAGITVSLFVDPDLRTLDRARALGVPLIELHTGAWAEAGDAAARNRELELLRRAAIHAGELGLRVNAGHGLTAENVGPVAALPGLRDLHIGHALVSRAVFLGLDGALAEMAGAIRRARGEGTGSTAAS